MVANCHFVVPVTIHHERKAEKRHSFTYRALYYLLDVSDAANPPRLSWWVKYRRRDYLKPTHLPLADLVRDRVEAALGFRPTGKTWLLTQVSALGFCFNPISIYYCFDALGAPQALLIEVTNTPWNERHQYVQKWSQNQRYEVEKTFHVSPFLGMKYLYKWQVGDPLKKVFIKMENWHDGVLAFSAGMYGEKHTLSKTTLLRKLAGMPFSPHKTILAIYFQALRLWIKGVSFFPHPNRIEGPHDFANPT